MDEINKKYLEAQKTIFNILRNELEETFDRENRRDSMGETTEPFLRALGFGNDTREAPKRCDWEIVLDGWEKKINDINEQAKAKGITVPLEKLCEEYGLTKDERIILTFLFFKRVTNRAIRGIALLKLISKDDPLSKIELISPMGKLRKDGLIKQERTNHFGENLMLFEQGFKITNQAFWTIAGRPELIELEEDNLWDFQNRPVISIKEPVVSFDHLVLPEEIKIQISDALWQYENGSKVYERYGLQDKIQYGQGVAMLFYGPPGTGKTATSEAIAKQLGKKLGIANYEQIYNCYVGESEKGIKRTFEEAKINNCILLFDEADSLFSKRIDEHHSVDRMNNIMTNLLMQQMENFSGMVILTTNREVVIDTAFERRLLLKLKFDLPPAEIRAKIWESFLKDCARLSPEVNFTELGHFPISGGKIKNAVIKAVMRCAKENMSVTMPVLIQAVEEEIKSSFEKEKEMGFKKLS